MIDGQKFYKIEALVSKESIDKKLKELNHEFSTSSNVIFNALRNNGIKCYEVSSHSATANIEPEHIALDVSGNGESTTEKDFKRFEIEYPESTNKTDSEVKK